jgi:16S rRNA (cytosine1402-N4)-methyltransferase
VCVDATFGDGGYSHGILSQSNCQVIAIDRDPRAITKAQKLQDEYKGRFVFVHGNFGDAFEIVTQEGYEQVDVFVMDLGVSSMQIDNPDRGFSFKHDGPLDMRMDQGHADSITAEYIVNNWKEEELAYIIKNYGEERFARRVAKQIVKARSSKLIKTTFELADVIRSVVPKSKDRLDPATRTFQALRIEVNKELEELERALDAAEKLLREGGRLIVVSFHSLEDSIVKKFMKDRSSNQAKGSRHLPLDNSMNIPVTFSLISKKAIFPNEQEIKDNIRSRSARMRVAIRTGAPPRVDQSEVKGRVL